MMKGDGPPSGENLQELRQRVNHWEELLRRRFQLAGLGTVFEALDGLDQQSTRHLQELGDSIPTPLFFKDSQGAIAFCNQALADLLGLPLEQIVGRPLLDFLPAEVAAGLEESGRLLAVTGLPLDQDLRQSQPDGRRDLHVHGQPPHGSHGRVLGLVGTVLDNSLQHQALAALRGSESRYRGLFESAQDAIFIMKDERFVESNPAAARIFGREASDLAGLRPMELSPQFQPDGRPSTDKAREKIGQALAGERQFFEWVHLRADGTPFDAEVSLSPLDLESGRHLLAIVRDTTQRKQTEAALRSSEEFSRGIIQHAPMGVMYVDIDGVLVYENPAMERMMGVPKGASSQVLGRSLAELPGLAHVPVGELLQRVGRGEVIRNLDVDYTSVYGLRSQLQVQMAPHADAGGRVIGAILLIQDVTELRSLEQQLRQAQKLDAIGSLAGGIAHDFNNLLTGVSGNAELALQHLEDAVLVRRCLLEQLSITQRAAELTRRLLTFSRQQESAPRPILLNRLLEDLEMMLRRLIGEAVTLDWQAAPGLWAIRADPAQIEQVVVNLVVNARDAMPDGGRLSLRVDNQELSPSQANRLLDLAPGPHVVLEVADTGCGIEESVRGRIFEPFFTTKEMSKGTGLGLSIVYAIVKKCGGDIAVDSQPGLGSSFRLYFPSIGPLLAKPMEAPAGQGPLVRGEGRILVIEDEDAVRELSVRLLEHCGYEVVAAADGCAALALAESGMAPVDLIFSDVIMPGMSGPAAVRRLLEHWPSARVLFCSGYTDGELSRHDLGPALGAGLLNKPFTMESLSRRIRHVLDGDGQP
ncbi:MAG: PAS domain-containing protein [bacterium]|jgi:PAS domain S-box-containing protein|nr:PAS domain-containing protein [bacterium]